MRPLRQGISRRHGQEPEPKGVLYPPSGALPSLKIAQDLAKAHGWDDYDVTSAVSLVLRDKIDKNTAAAIAAVSQSSRGTLSIKMHDKLAALVALGKHLGMFNQRTQTTNVAANRDRDDQYRDE